MDNLTGEERVHHFPLVCWRSREKKKRENSLLPLFVTRRFENEETKEGKVDLLGGGQQENVSSLSSSLSFPRYSVQKKVKENRWPFPFFYVRTTNYNTTLQVPRPCPRVSFFFPDFLNCKVASSFQVRGRPHLVRHFFLCCFFRSFFFAAKNENVQQKIAQKIT